jgi:hypothetical protein
LIDGRENVFLRPSGERNEERTSLDAEAVTSQVQLLLSRDLAREIIKKNKLAERPEFDPVLQGAQPWRSLLGLMGIGRDPFSMTPEERVLDAYYERSDGLCGRQVARHGRRIPVARSRTRRARRQFHRRRLSGDAAECAAEPGAIGRAMAVRRDR